MSRGERNDQHIQSGQDNKPERHLARTMMDQPAGSRNTMRTSGEPAHYPMTWVFLMVQASEPAEMFGSRKLVKFRVP